MSTPSFYAVIPAPIRYDRRISSNAKLLYAEITSLCSVEGYCYAADSYFTEFFAGASADTGNVSERTVRRWIKQLIDFGYLERVLVYDSKGGLRGRRLYLPGTVPENPVQYPLDKNVHRGGQNCPQIKDNKGIEEMRDRENITTVSNKAQADACACEEEVVLCLEENQVAYEGLVSSIGQAREAGANDGVTEDEYGAILDTLLYMANELAVRKKVRIKKLDIAVSTYLTFLSDVIMRGEHDRTFLLTIKNVLEMSLSGEIHNQFGYLVSTLWDRIKLGA